MRTNLNNSVNGEIILMITYSLLIQNCWKPTDNFISRRDQRLGSFFELSISCNLILIYSSFCFETKTIYGAFTSCFVLFLFAFIVKDRNSLIEPSKTLFTPKANSLTTQVKPELKEESFESNSHHKRTP